MIVTKLQGGLGNQLFQWAASENISIQYKIEVFYDLSYFNFFDNNPDASHWDLELNKFEIEINQYNTYGNLKVVYDDFYFKKLNNNCYLNGYWQSEKYFIDSEVDIRKKLKIKDELKNYIFNKYSFLNDGSVSLHVRRGDYIDKQDFHPLQNVQYYKNAYDLINDNNLNVVILSNDIDWCKQNLNFNNMFFIEEETNITDLYIMSVCQNNIIANSSFSWWGAWLNDNKEKKVVAPKKWFGSAANLYDGDIVPEKWIKL